MVALTTVWSAAAAAAAIAIPAHATATAMIDAPALPRQNGNSRSERVPERQLSDCLISLWVEPAPDLLQDDGLQRRVARRLTLLQVHKLEHPGVPLGEPAVQR